MEKKWDVVCIGAAIVDIPLKPVDKAVFDHDSYPLDRIAMTIGGDAINEATILARQGARVALAGLVGQDAPGRFVKDFCATNGIDASHVREEAGIDTSINIALVAEDGERTFITNRNGSLWKLSREHLDLSLLEQGEILSLASIFNNPLLDGPALEVIFQQAKQAGMTICADMIKPRLGETLQSISSALPYVDYLFANWEEACLMTGETELEAVGDVFLAQGVEHVLVKVGKKGCYVKSKEQAYHVPAYQGVHMADTIGAGDNFAAGFIRALLDAKPLLDCARYANAVASLSVEGYGATSGVQSLAQVQARYQHYLEQIKE